MNYISIFSGIEAATMAWHPLGFTPVAFSEIEKFPSAVLAHHYPDVPNVGDMTKVDWSEYKGKVDVVVGGPPCQAFSVAGLRESLDDHRGNLSLQYVKAIHSIAPVWAITENVPGWLSTKDNAFGCFLAGIVGADAPLLSPLQRGRWPKSGMASGPLGRAAWRVLDAQYFGLAQRRQRVFVVASFRDWADPAKILFERKGLHGDIAPRREKGKGFAYDVAPSLTASGRGVERPGESRGQDPVVAVGFGESTDLSRCDTTGEGSRMDYETTTMVVANPLGAPSNGPRDDLGHETYVAVSVHQNQEGEIRMYDVSPTISTTSNASGRQTGKVFNGLAVRRLTPEECEALQGFPRGFTKIPWRGKPAEDCPDGPRYKAIGNSMAETVMAWIGERLKAASYHQLPATPISSPQ